ncbi:tetratricopeptide repeat protein [Flavobacterium sp. 7A]|uniref:tetratricopeptide repeat protein n=1 Tax=Flavobacterium sp. 7A TaxID=2940571 RepID=UPI0022264636|nr:tetratricopeptide repeat protein [Flavobacterium sp. 7A]MCW2120062.1 hypothetical protein [Flavobacterium sp. 7A]
MQKIILKNKLYHLWEHSSITYFSPTIFSTIAMVVLFIFSNATFAQNHTVTNPYVEKANELRYSNYGSAVYYYKKSIEYNTERKDTVNVIANLRDMSDLFAHRLDYGKAYDGYWKALFLAVASKDDYSKAIIYQALGWLFSFYDRDVEALRYYENSLNLTKNNKKLDDVKKLALLEQDYFSILNLYRVKGDYKKARKYLDSCQITSKKLNSKTPNYFISTETAFMNAVDKKYEVAIAGLQESNTYFEKKDPSYLIIVNYLIGEVYRMKGDLPNSITYYEKSFAFSNKYKSHENYVIMVHEALAATYAKIGNFQKAYNHSNLALKINANVFGKGSKNSQHLFEINDKYRVQKQKEREILNKQRIEQLESEEKVWLLKSVLFSIILISLLSFGFLFVKNMRRKHKDEKLAIAEKQEMELQKGKEILELKNKELTTSALQLIEKDEFIERLKLNLTDNKENVDVRTINKMLKTIQGSPSSNWKEFEARFTAVNQSFYTNLKDKYPDLGQTDLKICALIKLNFSSKDMASLLGISFESVHTSRYRLRKKFKLERNDNLNEFISTF